MQWIYRSTNSLASGGAPPQVPPPSAGEDAATSAARATRAAAAAVSATNALCSAAYFGAVPGVEAALSAGGSVESADEARALMHARARFARIVVLTRPLRRGAEQKGMTALHWAAHGGHEAAAALLLARGARAGAVNKEGWTPLHYAACAGHTAAARVLLRAPGAHAGARNAGGRTPLQMAKDPLMEALLRDHSPAFE